MHRNYLEALEAYFYLVDTSNINLFIYTFPSNFLREERNVGKVTKKCQTLTSFSETFFTKNAFCSHIYTMLKFTILNSLYKLVFQIVCQ